MARGRGGGKTPAILVKLINEAIEEKGQSRLEQESGISHTIISRYKRGIGEPSTATLEKLADYFGVSPWVLRGADINVESIVESSDFGDKEINVEDLNNDAQAAISDLAHKIIGYCQQHNLLDKSNTQGFSVEIKFNEEHGVSELVDVKIKELKDIHIYDATHAGLNPAITQNTHTTDKNETAKQNRKRKTDDGGTRESKKLIK